MTYNPLKLRLTTSTSAHVALEFVVSEMKFRVHLPVALPLLPAKKAGGDNKYGEHCTENHDAKNSSGQPVRPLEACFSTNFPELALTWINAPKSTDVIYLALDLFARSRAVKSRGTDSNGIRCTVETPSNGT